MPKKVTISKNKINLGIAIFTVIVSLIPIIITSFTGWSSFKTPYGIYILSVFGICLYFSCIFAMFSWKNKILYIVMDIVNFIVSIGFVIYAYINSSYQGGLLLHIASTLLFTFGIYQMGDADQGDNIYSRYLVPIVTDIAGLIFVLWFINVHINVVAHIVIVSIINCFTLLFFLIPSIIKMLKLGNAALDDIQNDEVETTEETEEEKTVRETEKAQRKETKEAEKKKTTAPSTKKSSSSTRCWAVNSKELYWISEDATKQFNQIVSSMNDRIENNNYTIRNEYDENLANRAIASNKSIKKAIKYLRHTLKDVNKNLEKLNKMVFTEEHKRKSFTYDLLKGKLKMEKMKQMLVILKL